MAVCLPAHAQDYPNHIVRIVVPFVAGGGLDANARLVGAKLQDVFKQPVIVENRGGQAGNVGTNYVAKSPANGYTILITTIGHVIAPSLWTNLRYDTIKDFEPITMLGESTVLLVVDPKLPVRSVQEFVAYAKANEGKLNYGSSGIGNPLHMSMELFMRSTDTRFVMVPFTNDAQILAGITGGQLHAAMAPFSAARGHVAAGTLRALGTTRLERWPLSPDIPTIAEQGVPGYNSESWQGFLAPAGTPREIIEKLYSAIKHIMTTDEDAMARYRAAGSIPLLNRPEEFARRIEREVAYFKDLAQKIGLKPKTE